MAIRERPTRVDPGEVWLGDRPLRLKDGIVESDLANIFAKKVSEGDPGPDNHPVHTVWSQSDWTGGGQVLILNSASEANGRFWFSTSETQFVGTLALPPYTYDFNPPAGVTGTGIMLGDYQDKLWAAFGTKLCRYDVPTQTYIAVADLAHPPAGRATVYREKTGPNAGRLVLVIPESSGFEVWTGSAVLAGVASTQPVDFCVWDQKLFYLDTLGALSWASQVPAVVGDWTQVAALDDESTPKHLLVYRDVGGDPVVSVATDRGIWFLDFANSILLTPSDLYYPRHPYMAQAVINHIGDLIVAAGLTVLRYDGDTTSPDRSLDHDYSLPDQYRGQIMDFASTTFSGLYALVRGEDAVTDSADDPVTLEAGGTSTFYGPASQTSNLVMVHNGFGWHYRWDGQGVAPTTILVSQAGGDYALWWGAGGILHRQALHLIYFNARDLTGQTGEFAESSWHESGWWTWGWLGQQKLLKEITLRVQHVTPTETVQVLYKIDDDANDWVDLGTITAKPADGVVRFYIGQDPAEPALPDGQAKYVGVPHERLKLRLVLKRAPGLGENGENLHKTPIVEWHQAVCRRLMRPIRAYSFTVDLTETNKAYPTFDSLTFLTELARAQKAVVFQYLGQFVIVETISMRVQEKTTSTEPAYVNVTVYTANDLDLVDPDALAPE